MKPGRLSAGLAALAGLASLSASGVTTAATALGGVGFLLLLGGIVRGRLIGVALGALGLVGAVPLAALGGAGTAALLLATGTAALAYDLGETAVETRRLLDTESTTVRGEVTHAAGIALLLGVAAAGSLLAFRLAAGRGSTLAVAALLVGATAFVAAARVE